MQFILHFVVRESRPESTLTRAKYYDPERNPENPKKKKNPKFLGFS